MALSSKVFNPEKFKDLGGRLSQVYALSGQPPLVLKAYLAVMSKDEFEFGPKLGGRFAMADYDDRVALTEGSLKGTRRRQQARRVGKGCAMADTARGLGGVALLLGQT